MQSSLHNGQACNAACAIAEHKLVDGFVRYMPSEI
jgi:hypothetical protein